MNAELLLREEMRARSEFRGENEVVRGLWALAFVVVFSLFVIALSLI